MPMVNSTDKKLVSGLVSGLIVSCQAPADSPLYEPKIIAAIAHAAILRGASGVRIDTPAHVSAVREELQKNFETPYPIIGLWKQMLPDYEVYITPRFADAAAIAAAGADIIAIDATERKRPPGESLPSLIQRIHDDLGKMVMADVDTIEAAIAAEKAGADIVGTTLYGYTAATKNFSPPGFELLAEMVKNLKVPVICEGGISAPAMAKKALEIGADAVVVGTDITGIDLKVQAYQGAIARG
jgi:N-acylglucosamine-6-phosphate 2-epimerase